MKLHKLFKFAVLAPMALSIGILPIRPASAQDGEQRVRGRVVIRTPDGEQVIELDGSQLPDLGNGQHVIINRVGPNGEVTTFTGGPEIFNLMGDGALRFNGQGGLASMNGGSFAGLNVIDPGTSYLYALLNRTDVAQEIRLNARQREALEAAEHGQQAARTQLVKDQIASLTQGNTEEVKAMLAERAAKVQQQARANMDQRMKTLASILRPEQLARLKELDLQYRGPMSLGVNEVADQAAIGKELTGKVADVLKEYRQEVSKNLSFGARTVSLTQGANSGASAPAPPPPNSEEMRAKMVKAEKEIRKARVTLSAKALTLLPAQQRTQWQKISGKPFEFHPEL